MASRPKADSYVVKRHDQQWTLLYKGYPQGTYDTQTDALKDARKLAKQTGRSVVWFNGNRRHKISYNGCGPKRFRETED